LSWLPSCASPPVVVRVEPQHAPAHGSTLATIGPLLPGLCPVACLRSSPVEIRPLKGCAGS